MARIPAKSKDFLKLCEAEILSDKIARHEWEHRFKLMVVKRLGPSLVPFPRLLPMMMPTVLPAMLARMKDLIPMPDYMAEQIPDLMPKVMDNLKPHMIGDVVPLITQPMIDYLRGKNGKKSATA